MKDNQAKYPQLRFKGFTDPWEKRTLGQTTTKAKSYSLSRDVERDHETGYRLSIMVISILELLILLQSTPSCQILNQRITMNSELMT